MYCTNTPSDDPWNQTAADNAEWLERFKRDSGISSQEGPGLPDGYAWALEQGGSGFAPPYAYPKGHVDRFNDDVAVGMRDGSKSFKVGRSTANKFLNTLTSPKARPATVFCSRELETGLVDYVEAYVADKGVMPSDEDMKAKGREILDADTTSAEDSVVLGKFKVYMRQKLGLPAEPTLVEPTMDLNLTDADLGNMLQDMECEFALGMVEENADGGVRL